MSLVKNNLFIPFKERRARIIKEICQNAKSFDNSVLLTCAGFENHKYSFRQESSFYYLTGIKEPAVILCSYFDGPEVLYVPFYNQNREQWVNAQVAIASDPQSFAVDQIKYQGEQIPGYSCPPFFTVERYSELVADLKVRLGSNGVIYTLMDSRCWRYFQQIQLIAKLCDWLAYTNVRIEDVSDVVHNARRCKDVSEVALVSRAVDTTIYAHNQIAESITQGKLEYQIQGLVDFSFKNYSNCDPAFPSIVASGKNTTVLHATDNFKKLHNGDLVVVDIGAEFEMYAADLTRTYPVGGKFSDRQREVYDIVLQTQQYVRSLAKPGMYLNNRECPELSLHHLAVKFLQKYGYDKYFVHGIGHFLGLDVHDVGSHEIPLGIGDVFTIEPGIYISAENLGIRIEDDFVITETGCSCLSQGLVCEAVDIENIAFKLKRDGGSST